ncbi:sodium/calcium exchanger protein, partial [Striga asiatica]
MASREAQTLSPPVNLRLGMNSPTSTSVFSTSSISKRCPNDRTSSTATTFGFTPVNSGNAGGTFVRNTVLPYFSIRLSKNFAGPWNQKYCSRSDSGPITGHPYPPGIDDLCGGAAAAGDPEESDDVIIVVCGRPIVVSRRRNRWRFDLG